MKLTDDHEVKEEVRIFKGGYHDVSNFTLRGSPTLMGSFIICTHHRILLGR
jgi:hypothetical protein